MQNFPLPERIRGMKFSSARENKGYEIFSSVRENMGQVPERINGVNYSESPEFDFTQAP